MNRQIACLNINVGHDTNQYDVHSYTNPRSILLKAHESVSMSHDTHDHNKSLSGAGLMACLSANINY